MFRACAVKHMVKFDSNETGLLTVFRKYQVEALKAIYRNPDGLNAGQVCMEVNNRGIKISRPSVTVFCNEMLDEGLLTFRDATGKGGHSKVYQPKFPTFSDAIDFLRKKITAMIEKELVV